jgi:hypothetical protein
VPDRRNGADGRSAAIRYRETGEIPLACSFIRYQLAQSTNARGENAEA